MATFQAQPSRISPQDLHRQGAQLLERGQTEEACGLLEQALRAEPTAERWNDWGAAQMACGRHDRAEEGFRAALAADPAGIDAAANLGVLLASLGRIFEALPLL